jgi:hypothetical protein
VHRLDDPRIRWDAPRRCRNSRCVVPPQVVRCKVRQLSRPFSGRHRRGGPTDTKRSSSRIAEGRAVAVVIELTHRECLEGIHTVPPTFAQPFSLALGSAPWVF